LVGTRSQKIGGHKIKMNFSLKKIILIVILVLSAVLRLYSLDEFPSGLNADEAAIGYNAYSLLRTGRDEHGNAWPIVFKSFGDYKPGGYFYLVVPLVKIIGLNILAVRLPSALLGVLSVWLIYVLAGEVAVLSFGKSDKRYQLLTALLLAISPWHIHFSRGGWETNAGTTMLLAGVVFFLKGLNRRMFLLSSVIFFVFSMYIYQSTRLIAPVLGLGLVLIFFKQVWPPRREFWLSTALGFLLLLPLIGVVFSPGGLSRFSGVGLTADTGPIWRVNELRGQHGNADSLVVKILHNKVMAYAGLFARNYLEHFSGNFLFISGDVIPRNRVPEMGQMYLIEIPILLLGVYVLVKKGGRGTALVFYWLAVSPLAAALTFQTPHALRAQNMVIPLVLVTAAGFTLLVKKLTAVRLNFPLLYGLIAGGIALSYGWSVSYYLNQYYIHYPKVYPDAWEYGFEQVARKVGPLLPFYNRVIMTDTYDQPYIEMLFFLKYPPAVFQKEVVLSLRDKYGFSTVKSFGKFDFAPIIWEEVSQIPGTLVIGTPKEIPSNAQIIDRVVFPSGEVAFEFASI